MENGRVGYLDTRLNASHDIRLDLGPTNDNLASACAEFIIKETNGIRDRALKNNGKF